MTVAGMLVAVMADGWNLHHIGRAHPTGWFAQLCRGGERVVARGEGPIEALENTLRAGVGAVPPPAEDLL